MGRRIRNLVLIGVIAASMPPRAGATERASDLSRESLVVVAVVDTGINPYHADFRRPDLTQDPSTYIAGYPGSATRLDLALSAQTFKEAVARDRATWDRVDGNELYWIPGTNIIGATGPAGSPESFLDDDGHGTATSSLASGAIHGPRSDNVLLVAVEGGIEGLRWAANQPWIDLISTSWGVLSEEPQRVAGASREAVANGKVVCVSSGNLYSPIWWWGTQGPSWNLNVGGASAVTRGDESYSGYPNDVLGLSTVMAATRDSLNGESEFSGTSAATPNACGQIARMLADVRAAIGDRSEGSEQSLASGRAQRGPYLDDGCLDSLELEDAIQATATPAESAPPSPDDPDAIPALPAGGFVRDGYGIVDRDTANVARDVLLGRVPRPERSLEDHWLAFTDSMRDHIYGPRPKSSQCR